MRRAARPSRREHGSKPRADETSADQADGQEAAGFTTPGWTSGRRSFSQSRRAQNVVLNAILSHGIASGAYASISVASGVGAATPPTIRASNTIVTTAASSRVYNPTISPGSTSSPVSSNVSRIAPWLTVSSTSRKPPGCAQSPMPGSMPRRISTISPASVIGSVVTTSRGLTYVMWPQTGQAWRSRSSPATVSNDSFAPQREQKLSAASIQRGTPRPDGRSVERPSGPRSNPSVMTPLRQSSCEKHDNGGTDQGDEPHDAHRDPRKSEQALAAVHGHPRPGGTPDAQDRIGR